MNSPKRPVTPAQKAFREKVSPATIAEILLETPAQARRLWIGMTGDAKEPNFQYEIHGRIIRRSLKHLDKLDAGSFDPRRIVEIDPNTGVLLPLQDQVKAVSTAPTIIRATG